MFKVTFNTKGGSPQIQPVYVLPSDGIIGEIEGITRSGYVFDGWFDEETGDEWDLEKHLVQEDMTLNAKWSQITVTFNGNGGKIGTNNTSEGKAGTNGRLSSLPTPVRGLYTFGGWFTSPTDSTNKNITTNTVFTKHDTVYARWTTTDNLQFNTNVPYGFFTDTRDTVTYRIVKIGKLTSMAENLNYAGQTGNTGVCYNDSAENCAKYGRLYNWAEAMGIASKYNEMVFSEETDEDGFNNEKHQGICPDGWRLPRFYDWDTLMLGVGNTMSTNQGGPNWGDAGRKLKSTADWIGNTNRDDDSYGFSALPGGHKYDTNFQRIGQYAYWWLTQESVKTAFSVSISSSVMMQSHYNTSKANLNSVRCVKD